MSKPPALERFERLTHKLADMAKHRARKPEEKSVFASFQDRLMASVIDTTILFFLFRDLFHWISSLIYRRADLDLDSIRQRGEIVSPDPLSHAEHQVHLFFDSGLADLWLFNSFVQSVILGIALVLVWSFYHTTPGKYLLGMRFASRNGEGLPSTGDYILRYASFYLSMPFLMIGFAWLGFDRQKRAWHDRIAGTTVIYTEEGSIFRQFRQWLKQLIKSRFGSPK